MKMKKNNKCRCRVIITDKKEIEKRIKTIMNNKGSGK
tara:strand:- start:1652 stop:1762 length:111 start_codon:yes stop_codon:yes gene_type:complete